MQELLLYIVVILICVVIYLLITQKKNITEDKSHEELSRLKDSLFKLTNTMSTSFNFLSKDVTRDMTKALTKVEEKVGIFNQQVETVNKSQDSFSRILGGVKQYGGPCRIFFNCFIKGFIVSQSVHVDKIKILNK